MKAHESHITAKEAKERLYTKLAESDRVQQFMEKVSEAIANSSNSFEFQIGYNHDNDFTDQERTYLEKLGYDFSYNEYIYTYTISWEI